MSDGALSADSIIKFRPIIPKQQLPNISHSTCHVGLQYSSNDVSFTMSHGKLGPTNYRDMPVVSSDRVQVCQIV